MSHASDLGFLDRARIRAEVLVELVRDFEAGLGPDRAHRIAREAIRMRLPMRPLATLFGIALMACQSSGPAPVGSLDNPVRAASLHHVHLMASDLTVSLEFYRRWFDAEVVADFEYAGARNVFVAIGSGRLHFYEQPPRTLLSNAGHTVLGPGAAGRSG